MNKRFLLWDNPRQAIFTLMAVLLLLGGINVFSASLYDNGPSYLFRYYFCALVGLAGIYFVRRIGYKRLLNKRFLWICYCIVLIMLVVVHFWGAANKDLYRFFFYPAVRDSQAGADYAVSQIFGQCDEAGRADKPV